MKLQFVFCLLLICLSLAGCVGLQDSGSDLDVTALTRPKRSNVSVRPATFDSDEGWSVDDISAENVTATVKKYAGYGPDRGYARERYREAEALFNEAASRREKGEAAAELAATLGQAAELYREAGTRWPESSLEEQSRFMAAEAEFFRDYYVTANDEYEHLLKRYPNTRYLDTVMDRRYAIANYWLEQSRTNPMSVYEVNLLDKSRPWRDEFGYAIRIFNNMRLDDPTGELADDATLTAANAYFQNGEYLKADEYYTDLRKYFPSSDLQFEAHYRGLQAKLNYYKGADYPSATLEEATELVNQLRRQFPREYAANRQEIELQARFLRFKEAEFDWSMAQYFDRKQQYDSAKYYYEQIVRDFSDTPFAEKARERVNEVSGMEEPERQLAWLSKVFPEAGTGAPKVQTSGTIRR